MISRKDKIKIGVFVVLTVVLGAFSLVTLMGVNLNESFDPYTIRFKKSIAGLTVGSQVQLRGVRVGSVVRTEINKKNVEEVLVYVELQEGTPVMSNTRAMLSSQGITGLQFIDLEGGTQKGERLKPGLDIQPGEGLLDMLKGRADEISDSSDRITEGLEYMTREENMKRLDRILIQVEGLTTSGHELVAELTATMKTTRRIMEKNEDQVYHALRSANRTMGQLDGVLREAKGVLVDGRKVIKESDIPELVQGVGKTNHALRLGISALDPKVVLGTLSTLQLLLAQISKSFGQNQDQLRVMMSNLRQTTDYLKEVSRTLSDRPSRLIFDEQPKPRQLP